MSNYMNLNEPQMQDIRELLRILPGAHMTDVKVRIDGQDKWFEADWLYNLLREVFDQDAKAKKEQN